MSGELVHVTHQLGCTRCGCVAADPLAQCNAHAGRFALERTNHQLDAVKEIEPRPVEIRQGMKYQRREVCGIGDAIAFTGHQGACLLEQIAIGRLLVVAVERAELEHRFLPDHGGREF